MSNVPNMQIYNQNTTIAANDNESLKQLKNTLNQQLEFQKTSMETLIKEERSSHQK
jgi:hypothetical protein